MTQPATIRCDRKVNQGMRPGYWWALLRGPSQLPVIFATRQQARENRERDEYIVRVKVMKRRNRGR